MSTNQIFSNPCWRKTTCGTPIELWASAPLNALRGHNPILIMGGIHGDEPEGVRLARDLLQWLKSHSELSQPVNQPINQKTNQLVPWILLPCLNVDGFANGTRVNARGVDLNRNYPSKDWSSDAKAERYFPGTGPGSEVEIQGVVELIETYRPRLLIHCHSWQPCIVATGEPGRRDADRLGKSSGYRVMEDIGYPTTGSLSRFGWHDKQIPVICIEEVDGLADLSAIWPRFAAGFREIFEDHGPRSI
jgi:hypothetical protein